MKEDMQPEYKKDPSACCACSNDAVCEFNEEPWCEHCLAEYAGDKLAGLLKLEKYDASDVRIEEREVIEFWMAWTQDGMEFEVTVPAGALK